MNFMHRARFWQTRKNAAFTLVEMLVVITIIGILAALLMPSLQTAMGGARTTYCSNTQKQMGIANCMYVSDWHGYCVPLVNGASGTSWIANASFQEYMQLSGCFSDSWSYQYHCPDSLFRQVTVWNQIIQGRRTCLLGASYGMNYQNSGYGWNALANRKSFMAYRLNKLRAPGQTTMVVDSAQAFLTMSPSVTNCGYYLNGEGLYPPQCNYAPRHQNKNNGNHLFFDGHVQSIPAALACGNTGLWDTY